MKLTSYILVMLAALFVMPAAAYADVCSQKARQEIAGRPQLTLLSVRSIVNNKGQLICIVTVRRASNDGKPPRILTRRFKM